MKIAGIHHIAIIASDYARSKHFYTEVLGLEILAEAYRSERDSWKLDLRVSGDQLRHLWLPGRARGGDRGRYREVMGWHATGAGFVLLFRSDDGASLRRSTRGGVIAVAANPVLQRKTPAWAGVFRAH